MQNKPKCGRAAQPLGIGFDQQATGAKLRMRITKLEIMAWHCQIKRNIMYIALLHVGGFCNYYHQWC